MSKIAVICVGVVALIHIGILYKEMFDWADMVPKLLGDELEAARTAHFDFVWGTDKMAKNQALYNGFLAAGLVWSLFVSDPAWKRHIATFFLLCVAVAGVFGFITIDSWLILGAQTATASIALAFLHLTRPTT